MRQIEKLLKKMQQNPKADWKPRDIKALCEAKNLKIRWSGTSHAVITNKNGRHITVPMHKQVKPVYIKALIKLIAEHEI